VAAEPSGRRQVSFMAAFRGVCGFGGDQAEAGHPGLVRAGVGLCDRSEAGVRLGAGGRGRL
jgi:hypothetical protein